jgi:hypothetical protein
MLITNPHAVKLSAQASVRSRIHRRFSGGACVHLHNAVAYCSPVLRTQFNASPFCTVRGAGRIRSSGRIRYASAFAEADLGAARLRIPRLSPLTVWEQAGTSLPTVDVFVDGLVSSML